MKKNFKKTLISTLAVLAMAAAVPSSALCSNNFASAYEDDTFREYILEKKDEDHICGKLETLDIVYEIFDNHAMYLYGTGDTEITGDEVANLVNEYDIKGISFRGIKTIGEFALANCQSIERISWYESNHTVPADTFDTKIIKDNAFYNCNNLNDIQFNEELKHLIINSEAFMNCPNLEAENIWVPNSIEDFDISDDAFDAKILENILIRHYWLDPEDITVDKGFVFYF